MVEKPDNMGRGRNMRVHFNSSSRGAGKSIQKNRDARLCRFKCFLKPWWMCPPWLHWFSRDCLSNRQPDLLPAERLSGWATGAGQPPREHNATEARESDPLTQVLLLRSKERRREGGERAEREGQGCHREAWRAMSGM